MFGVLPEHVIVGLDKLSRVMGVATAYPVVKGHSEQPMTAVVSAINAPRTRSPMRIAATAFPVQLECQPTRAKLTTLVHEPVVHTRPADTFHHPLRHRHLRLNSSRRLPKPRATPTLNRMQVAAAILL